MLASRFSDYRISNKRSKLRPAPYHRPVCLCTAPERVAFLHRLAKATVCCRSRSQRARRKNIFCLEREIIRNNPKVRLSRSLLKAIGVFKGLSNSAAVRRQEKHSWARRDEKCINLCAFSPPPESTSTSYNMHIFRPLAHAWWFCAT